MSVLVGITTRNRCDILPKAIQSALEQEFSPLAVYIFDDHSTDETQLLKTQFPTITWETSSRGMGLVYARNKMMKGSSARYFCSLDDDAWFITPDVLKVAVNYMDSHAQVAAIAFDILSPDTPETRDRTSPHKAANFIGCGHLLRLEAVKEIGYYEPYPSFYGSEEMDLCIKLIDKGYQIVFLPGVHIWHDKINLDRDVKVKYRSVVCNDLVFLYRRSPFIFLIPALFLKFFSHLRFSINYKRGILFSSAVKGMLRFLGLFFTLPRNPVRISTFRKYYGLNRKNGSHRANKTN